ncbi:hypothetical protein SNE40_002577 [Patella caerulea]|uniref:Complex III subunit 9 n=1 Tax=Patella caerulea TaxID=87958 RepID=A0AAN8PZC4_PATCE
MSLSSLANTAYQKVFRKTSSFAFGILLGAFVFEIGFDRVSNYAFDYINRGKLYKDVKDKFAAGASEEE